MQLLTAMTTAQAYPEVPVYDLALTAFSLLISTILPLFVILFLQIRYKPGGISILVGIIQYMLASFLMLGGMVLAVFIFVDISDTNALSTAMDFTMPFMSGFFLPLAVYLTQLIFGNQKVKKTGELDQAYLGKTSVLAMWGGFTLFGDFTLDHTTKKWPVLLTVATVFSLLKSAFSNTFIEISMLYTGITNGRSGPEGSYIPEADYQDFYKAITSAPIQPALEFVFSFSIVLLLTILVFKMGSVHRFWPTLVLMPVCAALETTSTLISKSPLIYFFFVLFFTAVMFYLAPRLMRIAIPPKKPKWEIDPE